MCVLKRWKLGVARPMGIAQFEMENARLEN
jgi:hypothetical protein